MSDNIRTSLYDAEYDARLVSRTSDAPPTLARIVGKHCESGDIVVRDTWISGDVTPGDLLGSPRPAPTAIRCRAGTTCSAGPRWWRCATGMRA